MKLIEVDMHIHTTASDGQHSPIEIYEKIKETNKIKIFSITDHDTIAGVKELQNYLIKNPDNDITFIHGVEMTTSIEKPKYNIEKAKLHVLGYDFDLNHPAIEEIIQKRKTANVKFLQAQIESLKEKFNITFDQNQLNKIFEKSHFNRIDLAKALIEQGKAISIDEAYDKYLDPAKDPFSLIPIYEEEVFEAIKNAGGYVSLAHPTSLRLDLETLKEYIEYLKEIGLDAVEVYHSQQKRKYSYSLIKIAKELNLYTSGGSDYHGYKIKPKVHIGIAQGHSKQKKLTLKDKILKNK